MICCNVEKAIDERLLALAGQGDGVRWAEFPSPWRAHLQSWLMIFRKDVWLGMVESKELDGFVLDASVVRGFVDDLVEKGWGLL